MALKYELDDTHTRNGIEVTRPERLSSNYYHLGQKVTHSDIIATLSLSSNQVLNYSSPSSHDTDIGNNYTDSGANKYASADVNSTPISAHVSKHNTSIIKDPVLSDASSDSFSGHSRHLSVNQHKGNYSDDHSHTTTEKVQIDQSKYLSPEVMARNYTVPTPSRKSSDSNAMALAPNDGTRTIGLTTLSRLSSGSGSHKISSESGYISSDIPVAVENSIPIPTSTPKQYNQKSDLQYYMSEEAKRMNDDNPEFSGIEGAENLYPYMYYQPGAHAKAGPLPAPPRNILESLNRPLKPSRPPRLFAPGERLLGTSLSKDASVEARSNIISGDQSSPSKGSVLTVKSAHSNEEYSHVTHIREAAELENNYQNHSTNPTSPDPLIEPEKSNSDSERGGDHIDGSSSQLNSDCNSQRSTGDESKLSVTSQSFSSTRNEKDDNSNVLTITNYAVLSPQSLEPNSSKRNPSTSTEVNRPGLAPMRQTSLALLRRESPNNHFISNHNIKSRKRLKAAWPHAMHFGDILRKKGSWERAVGYAQKINELAGYECGLGDWVIEIKEKLVSPRQSSEDSGILDFSVPNGVVTRQPRHSSHGSINSEMTFPRRPDAYVATDLSVRPMDGDSVLPPVPSTLPYPTLARASTISTSGSLSPFISTRNILSVSGNSKLNGGKFFSSMSRKTNGAKDRYSFSSSSQRLSNRLSVVSNINSSPRPVQITSAPSVPGGPRAIPNRAQTLSAQPILYGGPNFTRDADSGIPGNQLNILNSHMENSYGELEDADFKEKLSKLSHLLPHAQRSILSSYLRRTGSEIKAVEQYLEDERNNKLVLE